MKFSFLFSLFSLSPKKSFIENGAYPLCKNCVYYRPDVFELFTPYHQFGRCTKYGRKEVVSGYINYEYANLCRKDEEQCGVSGKDYVARPDLLTLINYTMQHFSENSSKSKYICEKINSIGMDKTLQKTEKKNEEQTEKEKDAENCSSEEGNCSSEEGNCSTEFCNECYSDDCKKKSTKTVD